MSGVQGLLTAQLENSLLLTAARILEGERLGPDTIDAFARFVQSLVLFEKIDVVRRPNRESSSLDYIDTRFRDKVFSNPEVIDFDSRISRALSTVDALLERQVSSKQYEHPIRRRLRGLETLIRSVDGQSAVERFWSNIDLVARPANPGDYIRESMTKIDSHFLGDEVEMTSPSERFGLYYAWRCAYNFDLSRDNSRQYVPNPARSSLIRGLSGPLRAARLVEDAFEETFTSFLPLFKSADEAIFWGDLFLIRVLEMAGKPDGIWDSLWELHNTVGKAFRDECKKRAGDKDTEASRERLHQDLEGIFRKVQGKSRISIPFTLQLGPLGTSEAALQKLVDAAVQRADKYLPSFLRFRRYEMLWHMLDERDVHERISPIIKKVFDYEYGYEPRSREADSWISGTV
jgi:hypothetical protein